MKEKIIYLLDYGLSKEMVFSLGWELRKKRYLVIPISPTDLMGQLGKYQARYPIISFVMSKEQLTKDISFKRRYLLKALKNFKIKSVEFTSFKNLLNQFALVPHSNFKQYGLPLKFDEIVKIVHEQLDSVYEEDRRWPGGRRGSFSELGEK